MLLLPTLLMFITLKRQSGSDGITSNYQPDPILALGKNVNCSTGRDIGWMGAYAQQRLVICLPHVYKATVEREGNVFRDEQGKEAS